MNIEVPDEVRAQAIAAGFASVEDYVADLVERDAERIAIQKGIDDWRAGCVQQFDDFDRQLRKEFGFASRA